VHSATDRSASRNGTARFCVNGRQRATGEDPGAECAKRGE
jgi:hypothetical protein